MKRLLALCVLSTLCLAALRAQQPATTSPFKGTFVNKEFRINLVIDADSASITIPGLSFLGPTNGYMGGNIYGIWMVTSCEVKGSTATFRLSNDQGADSQTIRLTPAENGGLNYEAIDGNEIKRASGRKLIKIPTKLFFEKQ